jgi:creatinine amidohydrolase
VHLFTTATSTEEATRGARVAVLPVGSFEQHGDHLPLTTDTIVACVIAEHLASTYGLLLLPPITVSCSHEHEGFSGTVSISAHTLIMTVADIRSSLDRSGIRHLVIVNGHGGNYVLMNIVREGNVAGPRMALFPGRPDVDLARERAKMTSTTSADMHGGEWETSILLHAYPELVRATYTQSDHDAPHRPYLLITGMRGYTSSGIIGRPSAATAEKGKAALDSLVASFADMLGVLTA